MMTGKTGVNIREPIVAGQFYPDGANACRDELEQFLRGAVTARQAPDGNCVGGLVPHAGWRCSGAVTADVFAALSRTPLAGRSLDVIVLFGGVHRYRGHLAPIYSSGKWQTPLGPVEIDSAFCDLLLGQSALFTDAPSAHDNEHSLEVQMPFVRHVFSDAKVVPIMVPIDEMASEIGKAVGRTLSAYDGKAMIIGTTDLTHYGPGYGFVPHGVGAEGNAWAKNENDRRFVELVCSLNADALVREAADRRNACNSGAAAATVAACVTLGATRGVLLQHTTSCEVLSQEGHPTQIESVGYAGIVFET